MVAKEVTQYELAEELNMTEDEVIELLQGLRNEELSGMTVDNFGNWKDGNGISFVTTHKGEGYEIEYAVSYRNIKTDIETDEALEEMKRYMENEAEMNEEIVLVK